MNRLASKPMPIQAWGYQYDGEFSVRGIQRVEPSEIIRLLFERSESSDSESGQWGLDRADIVTYSWLAAQLDLHGIRYAHSASREDCLDLLRREVLKPEFNTLHPSILHIARFKEMKAEWEDQCRAYEESVRTGHRKEEFNALATLEEKVNYDPDMFMEVYFGNRNTMRRPIALKGVRFKVVQEAASRVPGLIARMIGDGIQKILCLGWNEGLVETACDDYRTSTGINAAAKRRLKRKYDDHNETSYVEKEMASEEWLNHMELRRIVGDLNEHHQHMRKRQKRTDIEGSYIVDVTDPDIQLMSRNMTPQWIDIRATSSPGVYEGSFDIVPMYQGVMLFSESQESLLAHADMCDAFHVTRVNNDADAFRIFQAGFMLGWQRKWQTMEHDHEVYHRNPPRVQKYMKKKTPEGTTRYYMRWRGDGESLKRYWKLQGRRGRTDERDDGWVEFREENGGKLIVDFGIGTIDGEFHAYKVKDEPFCTGDWATIPKQGPWESPLSATWAH